MLRCRQYLKGRQININDNFCSLLLSLCLKIAIYEITKILTQTIIPLARVALLFQYCPITHKSGESMNADAIPELNIDGNSRELHV